MLGVSFEDVLPKDDEIVKIDDMEIRLNSSASIEECKKLIDKINSLT